MNVWRVKLPGFSKLTPSSGGKNGSKNLPGIKIQLQITEKSTENYEGMQKKDKKTFDNQEERRTVKLDLVHSYGAAFDTNLSDCCYLLDNDIQRVIYPIGRFMAIKDMETKDKEYEINFLKLNSKIVRVDSISMSQDKTKLAIAQRLKQQKGPNVFVYNINPENGKIDTDSVLNLVYQDTKAESFVSMDFSKDKDSRFLACVTDYLETHIVFYNLRKPKNVIVTSEEKTVKKIRICPGDTQTLSISGPKLFKIFRVFDSSMRTQNEILKLDYDQNFTDHQWLSGDFVCVGTDKGRMFIIGKKDQKYVLFHGIKDAFYDKEISISSIRVFSRGLFVASSYGHFSLWMKDQEATEEEDKMKLKFQSHFKPPRNGWQVISMDLSLREDKMVIAFANNHISFINTQEIINGEAPMVPIKIDEPSRDELRLKMISVKFRYLYKGFHFGPIDHVDICVQRPLIATCSNSDSYVRIWNYMDFKCELAFLSKHDTLDGEKMRPLLSLAFHPSGYYLALGLTTVLRMMLIMDDRPYEYRDISLKGVSQLKFSKGGQYLAAGYPKQKSNYYIVTIMNSYTLEFIKTIPGNVNRISDLHWGHDDLYLYSASEDGNLCIWNSMTLQEEYHKATECTYRGVVANRDRDVYLSGYEKNGEVIDYFLRERDESNKISTFNVLNEKVTNICLLETFLGHSALLCGTESGEIKIYTEALEKGPYDEIKTHLGRVNRIIASPNGRYVFSVGDDGLLNIYQVTNIKNGIEIQKEGEENDGIEMNLKAMCTKRELADIVLVDKKDILLYKEKLDKHKQEIESLNTKLEQKAIEVKNQLEEEKRQYLQMLNQEIEMQRNHYNQLQALKQYTEIENANLLKANDENYLKAVEDLEALYEKKLTYENEKYLQLEQELLEERLNNEKRFKEMQGKNEGIINELRKEFKGSYDEAKKVYDETRIESKNLEAEYKERLAQQEEEHELEIRELNSKHKAQVESLSKLISQTTSAKDRIELDYQKVKHDHSILEKKVESLEAEIGNLQNNLLASGNQINKLNKELEDNRQTMRKKESQIYDAKSKINDLQKAKHVLSFRTTEMRKSLEPKEAQIEKLKEELFKLEGEFEIMLKTTHEQNEQIKNKNSEIARLNKMLKDEGMDSKRQDNLLNRIKMDIFNCVGLNEMKDKVKEIKRIYQQYVKEDGVKEEKHDPRGIEEMMRQIEYLEKSIHQINIATDKLVKNREMQIMKRTKHNIQLIKDLNLMRINNKELSRQNGSLKIAEENLQKKNEKLLEELKRHKVALEKFQKGKIRMKDDEDGEEINPQPPKSGGLIDLKGAQVANDGSKTMDLVRNKPQQASDLLISYQKEIKFLRSKLRSLNLPEIERSQSSYSKNPY